MDLVVLLLFYPTSIPRPQHLTLISTSSSAACIVSVAAAAVVEEDAIELLSGPPAGCNPAKPAQAGAVRGTQARLRRYGGYAVGSGVGDGGRAGNDEWSMGG